MFTHQIKSLRSAQQLMDENLLVKHLAGSHAYGTSMPTSDIDYRGIFVADPVNIRTPFFTVGEVDDGREEDTKIYELNQFMKLALDCNPNVVETLWVDKSSITFSTPGYDVLREHAADLLSAKIAFTTSGYALSQLKRIKGHNKWIMNPQSVEAPKPIDYISLVHNFTDQKMFKVDLKNYHEGYRLIPYEKNVFGVYEADGYKTFNNQGSLLAMFDNEENFFTVKQRSWFKIVEKRRMPLFIIKFNKEVYEEAKIKWEQYWSWKKNRNEKRSELEEQFGYDTKHAMHLVRLLRMGVEALTEGKLHVNRPDAEELLSIRNGAWTYEQIVKYAEEMDRFVKEDLYPKTLLPKKPNIKLAAQLILEIQDLTWKTT